jgi:predicted regulator of Ras-like GTPase activity (Roadblock/LC7/MglB family)
MQAQDGGFMTDLARIARIPNVASAVLGDQTGVFYDAIRESDGESVAAVTGFISSSMGQAGEQLGLGALGRVSLAGASRACIIAIDGGAVVTISVAPPGSVSAVERALDTAPGVRG